MPHVEARGHFEITISEVTYTKELKNFPKVYHVRNMVTDVVEFEAVHYFNCLRYIHDAAVQEAAWDKQLDVTLVKLADEMDAIIVDQDNDVEDFVFPDDMEEDPEGLEDPDNDPLLAG